MPQKIGIILRGYPRFSETFIANEIYAIEQRGISCEIFAMLRTNETCVQPIVGQIRAPVTYLLELEPTLGNFIELMRAQFIVCAHIPVRYMKGLFYAVWNSLRVRNSSAIKRLWQAAWLINYKQLLKHQSITHWHCHFLHKSAEFTWFLSQLTKIPYSVFGHAKDIYTTPAWQLRQRINSAQLVITCTRYNLAFLQALSKVKSDKIKLVYHGVSLQRFKPNPQRFLAGEFVPITVVGRLVAKKGYPYLLAALAKLKSVGVPFYCDIYGDGELRDELLKLKDEYFLTDRITFHGAVDQTMLLNRMNQKKSLFVLPCQVLANGDRDGIPNVIAEAMAMELPVIATNISGIPELVVHGETGLLIPEKNVEALFEAIMWCYKNPLLAEAMGKRARAQVKAIFSADVWQERLVKLLVETLELNEKDIEPIAQRLDTGTRTEANRQELSC